MPIARTEVKLYKSAVVNDLSTNGGRISVDEVISATLSNFFPHAMPEELISGSSRIRKGLFRVANDDDLTLFAVKLFLDAPTSGADWATLWKGTQRDTVADHPAPRRYGVAFLAANVAAGASAIILQVEDASIAGIFQDGDGILITDKLTVNATSGNRELHTISGDPVVVGTQVTITIAGTLANAYLTTNNARVSSIIEYGDVLCSVDNWVETGAGSYDESTYPMVTDNIGTIEQTWTFTWIDASTFNCVGDTVGSVGSGTIGSNFAPVNPANGKPYFTLRAAGHAGTHTGGDTLVCQTHPPTIPFYINRVIPPGSTSINTNRVTLAWMGATS